MKTPVAVLLSVLSLPLFAGEVLIPAAYRRTGAQGTSWKTEIVVANISGDNTMPVQTTITFHRPHGVSDEVRMPLSPKEVIAVEDALWGWFGVEKGGGIVRVTWEDQP